VIGIPKTVDNDLPVTDHCPGYGSVIKYIASSVKEMSLDHESIGQHDFVSIVEVMGRNAGWIAAGASLAKRRNQPEDAPHIILMPEIAFDSERFLFQVQETLKKHRYCMVVVGEGLVDAEGNYLSAASQTADSFGHASLGGAGDYLHNLVESNLGGIRVRSCKLGIAQRAAAHCSSQADNDEAYLAGAAAVKAAVDGETDKMVTLVRSEGDQYGCETSLAPLEDIANQVKPFPGNWINEDGISLSYQYQKYAAPLIEGEVKVPFENGVPQFVALSGNRVQKQLAPYQAG
ncbi:MAG: diphosphate--fructose-6-phosphate 1-phosphotransferase, partial [Puniceicoccales bacterium]